MRVPTITNVFPPRIYNLALSTQIVVFGRDFLNSHNLWCLLRESIKVKAIFESDSQVICRFKGHLDTSIAQDIRVQISNDNGNTYSTPHDVLVVVGLPQFRYLLGPAPGELKSNTKYRLKIKGMNLRSAGSIGIKI